MILRNHSNNATLQLNVAEMEILYSDLTVYSFNNTLQLLLCLKFLLTKYNVFKIVAYVNVKDNQW